MLLILCCEVFCTILCHNVVKAYWDTSCDWKKVIIVHIKSPHILQIYFYKRQHGFLHSLLTLFISGDLLWPIKHFDQIYCISLYSPCPSRQSNIVVKQRHTLRHYRPNVTRDMKFFSHLCSNNLVMKLPEIVLLRLALWGLIIMCLGRFVAWGRPHQSYILGELVRSLMEVMGLW